jgi:hypothetical protein
LSDLYQIYFAVTKLIRLYYLDDEKQKEQKQDLQAVNINDEVQRET